MKSKFSIETKVSSAALLTALGILTASAAQASPHLQQPSVATEEFAASTQVAEELQPSVEIISQAIATPETSLEDYNPEVDLTVADPLYLSEETEGTDSMEQINNVFQLRDVSPGDWAFEALRNLVERYGCIAGYPDSTFRGNRALSRYEFAAGVNSCLQQIERLMATGPDVDEGAIQSLQRLVREFEAELAALGTRVDNLEGRVAFLEDHQFSTTTKLFGQVVMGVQGRTENEFDQFLDRFEDGDTNINLITNTQLSLFTQFGPRSLLLTGLQAGTGATVIDGPSLRTFVGLGYEGNTDADVVVSDLTYRHLIGDSLAVLVGTEGVNAVNVFRGSNRVESAGYGPLSRFAQRNPVISVGGSGGGVGFDWQILNRLSLQAVYSASSAEDPDRGGLFGGDDGITAAGLQLVASPVDSVDIAFQYVNSYSPFGFLGTGIGDNQMAILDANSRAPMQTNAFGGSVDWRITSKFTLGGWAGYTTSDLKEASGSVETFNWMAYLNFPDLFGEGNLGGLYVGQPPKITNSDLPDGRNIPSFINEGDFTAGEGDQPSTSTHVEAFYRFRVSDNISITPGVIVVFNPGHNEDNDTITIGAIRTTFSF